MSERTFNQIAEQYHGPQEDPTVLIRRGDLSIQPAIVTNERDEYGRVWVKFTDPKDGELKGKPISLDNLSDDAQAALAEELGGPLSDDEAFIDTIPRNELLAQMKHVEALPDIIVEPEEVGEAALGAVGIEEPISRAEQDTSTVEFNPKQMAAVKRIESIMGEKGDADNSLANVLRQAGENPFAIVTKLAGKESGGALRNDVSLVLARRMAELLAEGGHFHGRVQDNNPNNLKNVPGGFGYEKDKYPSDEYVVLLALAKLDGSFDYEKAGTGYDDLPKDHQHNGQHRQAADALLESFSAKQTAAPEREFTDDEVILQARQSIDELRTSLVGHIALNEDDLSRIRDMVRGNFFDTDHVDEMTNKLAVRVQQTYQAFQDAINTINRLQSDADGATLKDVRRQHTLESTAATLRQAMNSYSSGFALNGIGAIDRLTAELNRDQNMQLQYRSQVPQIVEQMMQTQSMLLRMIDSAEL